MIKKYKGLIQISILLGLGACFACQTEEQGKSSRVEYLPFYGDASFTPSWLNPDDPDLVHFHRVSDFQLINQEGEVVTAETFANKIYVVDFFFTTCPGICPRMTNNMALLQDAFLDDPGVLLLSHSVTPDRDSVSVLKGYAESKGVDVKKWQLVTGSQEEIYRLGRNDYFVEEDLGVQKDPNDFLHTENFVLVDPNRHLRGIYNGLNQNDINQLIADIKTLQRESIQP